MKNIPRFTGISVDSNNTDKLNMLKDDATSWITSENTGKVDIEGSNLHAKRIKVDFLTRSELLSQATLTTEQQEFLEKFTDAQTPNDYHFHGLIIPLYAYPQTWLSNTVWDKLIGIINQHTDVPVKIIVNPSNGAGSSINSDYTTLISRLRNTHAQILGYTATNYAATPIATVQSDMDNWKLWYDIDGFFFDETSSDFINEAYYTTLTDYARTLFDGSMVANCGVVPDAGYFTLFDIVVTWENYTYPTNPELPESIDYQQKCLLYYGKDFNESTLLDNAQYFGWIYLNTTSDWANLSTYNLERNMVMLHRYDVQYVQEHYHPKANFSSRFGTSAWYGSARENLFINPENPLSQTIHLNGLVSVSVYSGTLSCSYGTASNGNPLFFFAEDEDISFTADCTYPMVSNTAYAPPYGDADEHTQEFATSSITLKFILTESLHLQLMFGTTLITIGEGVLGWSTHKTLVTCADGTNTLSLTFYNDTELNLQGTIDGLEVNDLVTVLELGEHTLTIDGTITIDGTEYDAIGFTPTSMTVGEYFEDQITEITYEED